MSTAPAVIDWLVANVPTLPACAGVLVSDGYPDQEADTMVIIGVSGVDGGNAATASATTQYVAIGGARPRDQIVEVHVEVQAATGQLGNAAQKQVRDTVYGIADALDQMIRADLTLGGLLMPGPAEVVMGDLFQTAPGQPTGVRTAVLHLTVRARNRV